MRCTSMITLGVVVVVFLSLFVVVMGEVYRCEDRGADMAQCRLKHRAPSNGSPGSGDADCPK